MNELTREFGALRATMEASATATAHAIEASATATAHAIEAFTAATTEMLKQLALQNKTRLPTPLSAKTLGSQMLDSQQLKNTMFSGVGEGDYKGVPELVERALELCRSENGETVSNTILKFCQKAVIIAHVLPPLLLEAKMPNMVVVNTETEGKIKSDSGGDLKPDVTIGPQVVFEPTDQTKSQRDFLFREGHYGELLWGLRDGYLFIADGKLVKDDEFPYDASMGQLGDHLTQLATHIPGRKIQDSFLCYRIHSDPVLYSGGDEADRAKRELGRSSIKATPSSFSRNVIKIFLIGLNWAKAASVLPTHFNTESSKFLRRGRE